MKDQSVKGKGVCTLDSTEVAVVGEKQNQNVVSKLLQELEDLAVQKSFAVASPKDQLVGVHGEGTSGDVRPILPLHVEGSVEAFVFEGTDQNKWSLVQTGPSNNKAASETEGETSNGIIVSPSRFNALAVPDDEDDNEDIEEGELIPDESKGVVPRTTKKGGRNQQHGVNKNPKKKVVNSRDLRLAQAYTAAKNTSSRKL